MIGKKTLFFVVLLFFSLFSLFLLATFGEATPFTEKIEGLTLGETVYVREFSKFPKGALNHPVWGGTGGEFTIEKGGIRIRSEKSNPVLTYLPNLAGDLTFRFRFLNTGNSHWAGVLIYDTYAIRVSKQSGGGFSLSEKSGDTLKELIIPEGVPKNPNDYILTVAIKEERLLVWLDGNLMIDYHAPDLKKEGRLSFISGWGSDWYIENVAISQTKSVPVFSAKVWPIKFGVQVVPDDRPVETIVSPGGTFTARVPVENPGKTVYEGNVHFSLLDFWEKVRANKELVLKLNAGEKKVLEIPFSAPERGVFKVAVKIEKDGTVWEKDVSSFACWPEPSGPPDPDSFFGNHVNSWGGAAFLQQASRLGQSWMRNHNMLQTTWWNKVQPEPGEFKWTHDFQLDAVKKFKMPVLGQFFGTPYWAGADGPLPQIADGPLPQIGGSYYGVRPDLAAFRKYVLETVKHYKDYIHYWEIWNEPENGSFWNGSPEEFAQLCKVAYEAAKEADPNCVIMVGGHSYPAWRWHEQAAKAGVYKYADIISFHYGCPMKAPEETFVELKAGIDHFQKLAVEYGPGHKLPLWDTEGGTNDTTWLRGLEHPDLPPEHLRPPMSWREGAIRIVQGSAIHQILGIERHFHYTQNHSFWLKGITMKVDPGGMLDATNAPRPKLMARVVMAAQVDGTKYAGYVQRPEEGRFWAVVYQKLKDPGSVILWWAGDGGIVRVKTKWPGKIIQAVNIMGNPLKLSDMIEVTEEPSYLHVDAPADKVLEALKNAEINVIKETLALEKSPVEDKPDIPVLPDYVATRESPNQIFSLNLKPFCNMGFADEKAGDGKGGWGDEGPLNDMRDFPIGKKTFYGVPFDIIDPATNDGKSILTLRGSNTTPYHPLKVEGIPVNKKVRTLYFMHSAVWGSPGEIGKYVIHYADGKTVEIPIIIPINNNNWWDGYAQQEDARPVPIGVTNTASGKPAWRYVRVWEWENPRGDVTIVSLDFVSAGGSQTPILIAVTGVQL